jgi:ABC-2 type transport system permease protein
MDIHNAWAVAAKDFKVYRRKSAVIYATVIFPVIIGVVFPLILNSVIKKSAHTPVSTITSLMNAFSVWFLIGAIIVPTAIASYSLVGEKIQKSLEPLLATPMTDGEILLGKVISALTLPLASLYAGSILFMALCDEITRSKLGYYYYPNWYIAAILLVMPLVSLMSVELNIIISSRMNDVRSAQQVGTLLFLPFLGLFLLSETGYFSFTNTNLLLIGGIVVVVDICIFFVSRATFQREQILTRWK